MTKVALVCMPYQNLELSSLSIALLGSLLEENGVSHRQCYLHLDFAALIGREKYASLTHSGTRTGLLAELLFAEDYHDHNVGAEYDQRLREFFGDRATRRKLLSQFGEICVDALEGDEIEVVGSTTSIGQLVPSIWLAKLVKTRFPDRSVLLGGSGCSQPMGGKVLAAYPEVDFVVSGYGEEPLLEVVKNHADMPRQLLSSSHPPPLDDLPMPDYGQFLEQWDRFSPTREKLLLSFESSRGCWWGEKHHCKFCGINSRDMKFRAKSADRLVKEVGVLWSNHSLDLFATDAILSRTHLKEAIPRLPSPPQGPHIFYEIKANMHPDEVAMLKNSGVDWVQPGIESLSTNVLVQLEKGVSAIQNVALLKWCREQGVNVSWNLLCGVPGEVESDYSDQVALMERVPHLAPPGGVSPIRIDRYSPYFNNFGDFGWSGLEPMPEYAAMHPTLSRDELGDLAYHFDGVGDGPDPRPYLETIQDAVTRWQDRNAAGDGLFRDGEVIYRVEGENVEPFKCNGAAFEVMRATDQIAATSRLLDLPGVDEDLLESMTATGLVYRERGAVLNLAVRLPH